jgi:uncharacterized integral membrane protein (TIGR00698 family)
MLIPPFLKNPQRFGGRTDAFASPFRLLPGLFLTGGIAAAAFAIRQLPFLGAFSPMILAIIGGAITQNTVGSPPAAAAGVKFAMRPILRLGIILLGLQLTVAQVVAVGWAGIGIIAATVVGTFLFTKWLGSVLRVEHKLAELIAAGTSICGASAIIATNSVTNADDENVAYAVACVTIFGTISMFLYPTLPDLLRLDPHLYGLWAGASIHEITQVVVAAFQDGETAGNCGTIAKLSRVIMLAPLVIGLSLVNHRRASGPDAGARRTASAPVPWFVMGFLALVMVNSIISLPHPRIQQIALVTSFLLSMSLSAMGLEMNVRALRAKGLRPFLLGTASWLFVALFSLVLVKLAG